MAEPDRWERWAPATGIVFVVLFLSLFFTGEPPPGADAEQLTEYYLGKGEAGAFLIYFLVGLAAASLLWFAGSLRAALRRVEGAPGRLSAVAFGGGVTSAILLMVAGASFLGPFVVVFDEATESVDPTLHNVVSSVGFIGLNFAVLSSAVMIAAASLVAVRWGGLPRWFAWVGFLVAVALVLNVFYFFGFFVWLAWVLLASILLLVRPVGRAPATPGGGA